MSKNNLGITEGGWVVVRRPSTYITSKRFGLVCEMIAGNGLGTLDENAKLIADAGTTANKCGLLPSEVFKQRNDCLEGLVKVRKWYGEIQQEYLGEYTPVVFSEILSLIQSIEKTE